MTEPHVQYGHPRRGTFSPNANDLNATWSPPGAYSGTATLILTATAGCTSSPPFESKPIVVNPNPTLTVASQAETVCAGSTATINLTGLLSGSTSTVDYHQ